MSDRPQYTTTKAAELLGISASSVRRIRQSMELGQHIGRDWLLSDDDLEAIKQRDTKPGPKPKPTPPID